MEKEREKAQCVMECMMAQEAKTAARKHPKVSGKGKMGEGSNDGSSDGDLEAIREELDMIIHSPLKKRSAPRLRLVRAPNLLPTIPDPFVEDHELGPPQENPSGSSMEAKKVVEPGTQRSTRRLAKA